jgi:hypothetical protein
MGALARLRSTLSVLARLLAFGVARLVSRPRCAACAAALTARTIFCRTCALTVMWPEPTDGPGSAALYGGVPGGLTPAATMFITAVMSQMMDAQQSVPTPA